MERLCTVEMNMIKDLLGKLHYVHCGKPATHCVPDTIYERGYYLCPGHAEEAKRRKWTVQKLEGEG